nr:29 kDa ribonucleoprotein A, chloroplastic [Ipomoea batatas]
MATSATSLHFLSLTPQSLSFSKPNATPAASLSLFSLPSSSRALKLSSSSPFTFSARHFDSTFGSRFVRGVALSSEFDQIEEVEDEDEGVPSDGGSSYPDEHGFSPDLKLFVGNLPYNIDSAALAGLFQQPGNVEMVEVIYDKQTGRSRGFGFVTMSTVEEVKLAAQQFNGYELDGRAMRVNSGPPPPRRENSTFSGGARGGRSFDNANRGHKLHVGNLAWGVDDQALETLFSEQGKVMEARVVYDRDSGRSRGFGFVTYGSAEEANNAIKMLDCINLIGREIRVSHAESRPPRRQF